MRVVSIVTLVSPLGSHEGLSPILTGRLTRFEVDMHLAPCVYGRSAEEEIAGKLEDTLEAERTVYNPPYHARVLMATSQARHGQVVEAADAPPLTYVVVLGLEEGEECSGSRGKPWK